MTDQLNQLNSDPDYILLKRFGYSLKRLVDRYPEGVPDSIIAASLGCPEEDIEPRYQRIVSEIRKLLRHV